MLKHLTRSIFILMILSACSVASSQPSPTAMIPQAATAMPLNTTAQLNHQTVEDALKEVILGGQSDGASPGCSPRNVARFLVRFLEAFNRGEQEQLARFFFRDSPYFDVNLRSYIQRYRPQEHLKLLHLKFNHWESLRDIVHFETTVAIRRSDDSKGQEFVVEGKGAFHCATQLIYAWGIGTLPN